MIVAFWQIINKDYFVWNIFSRKQTFRNTVFDVSDVLSDCSIMLGQILEETVRLDIKHGRDLPLVRADRNQIDNVLVNLATNARDAMKSQGGGVLTITTAAVSAEDVARAGAPNPKDGDWAAIHVSDTGAGMDEATLKKIFEPFFTTKSEGKGSGLGLAMVYGVVQQSAGSIRVRSEILVGSTFDIILPAVEEEVAPSPVQSQATLTTLPTTKGHESVLVVEEDDVLRKMVAGMLTADGYRVMDARTASEGLARAKAALDLLPEHPVRDMLSDLTDYVVARVT